MHQFTSYGTAPIKYKVLLQNLKLRSLLTFDNEARILKTPESIKYYREPDNNDYPIDLAKNWQTMVFSESDPEHYDKQKTFQFLMKENKKPDFDFCTTRGALTACVNKYNLNNIRLVAIKFKNCIYLKDYTEDFCGPVRMSLQFKLRQHLFVDAPGDMPKLDVPVDQRDQLYAIFSCTLGKFKVLYSAEMNGVDNTEPLGDLSDPEVLNRVKFSMIKVVKDRASPFFEYFLLQSQFAGIQKLRLARFDEFNIVKNPIETIHFAAMEKQPKLKLSHNLKIIDNFLNAIKDVMEDVDCPNSAFVFEINRNHGFRYERHEGPNKYSFLDQEYIDFVNNMYN